MMHQPSDNAPPDDACQPGWPRSQPGLPCRIALISALILILELALIRLIPAEVRAISYFTNLVLIATFFGMGLGCILQQRRTLSWLLPVGMLLVAGFLWVGRGVVVYDEAKEVHYWLQNANPPGGAYRMPLFQAAVVAFVITSLPFIALGQALARAMDEHPRLVAYAWDIGGSLGGILLFVLSSMASVPPWVWPPLLLTVWSLVFVRSAAERWPGVLCGLVYLCFAHSPYESRWSPYYYIQYSTQPYGIQVWVNSSCHQLGVDFTATEPYHRRRQEELLTKWNRPYDWFREYHNGVGPERVLVLGAGTGNDVYVAVQNGAQHVVAVEIDPAILYLGEHLNRSKPFGDKRVQTVIDDARHFLRTSDETFDLIVFGTLDSQALLSSQANLRLENYVYTRESLLDAKRLLSDRGIVVVHYSVFKPWLRNRLYATIRDAFGAQSRIHLDTSNLLFNTTLAGAKNLPGFADTDENVQMFAGGIPSTDDWPFIYLRRRTIAPLYVKLFAVVLGLVALAFVLLRRLHPVTGLHANYLFLGLGFTLMESSAIVRLASVFGSTWVVNAVVFSAVLLTVFLGNLCVLRQRAPSLRVAWLGVCAFILLNYSFPVAWLFHVGSVLRVVLCIGLVGTPVFFASICFSTLFKQEPITGYPFGVNLVGAMAGGTIEYVSMATGMRTVWLVALGIYLAAWLSTTLARRCASA